MEKKDHYISVFMGTDYEIANCETVGELRSKLEEIIKDLPDDQELKIFEVHAHDGCFGYTLKDGINQ